MSRPSFRARPIDVTQSLSIIREVLDDEQAIHREVDHAHKNLDSHNEEVRRGGGGGACHDSFKPPTFFPCLSGSSPSSYTRDSRRVRQSGREKPKIRASSFLFAARSRGSNKWHFHSFSPTPPLLPSRRRC